MKIWLAWRMTAGIAESELKSFSLDAVAAAVFGAKFF